MKNKFTVSFNGVVVRIVPDYMLGSRANGPIGWVVGSDGERNGAAVCVARAGAVCRDHSMWWSDPLKEGGVLEDFQVDGEPVSAVEFDRALADECYA